ncbi:uncharacterized protein LOC134278708, partial [Saccostrea cucullata]|uniref:uncharacterized protein LOC134278708 n=1 Tax=Saccostrea cuccullata TaxID=36930 RepID=UPI002ED28066
LIFKQILSACPPGYFGKKCLTICPQGFYGDLCTHKCTVCDEFECHHIKGCQRLEISTFDTSSKRFQTPSSSYDKETYSVKNQNKTIITTEITSQKTINHHSISITISTPYVVREKNNINKTIIVVGGVITLCLVILIIQVGYKQILQYRQNRVKLLTEHKQIEETYAEINDGILNSNDFKDESFCSKKTNKYKTIIHISEISGREYQDISDNPLISNQEENSLTSAAQSGCSGDSYLIPKEQVPLHTYTDVIDVSPPTQDTSADYLDPVLELTSEYNASERNHPYHDIVEPLGDLNVTEKNKNLHSGDTLNSIVYLDVVNS